MKRLSSLKKYLELEEKKGGGGMKIFISQPMKGRDAEEIQKEREEAICALKLNMVRRVEIINSFGFPQGYCLV